MLFVDLRPPTIRNVYRLNYEFLVLGQLCNMVATPLLAVYCARRRRKMKVRGIQAHSLGPLGVIMNTQGRGHSYADQEGENSVRIEVSARRSLQEAVEEPLTHFAPSFRRGLVP